MQKQKMDVFGDALATLGQDIAEIAAQQDAEANASWEKTKTMFNLAKTLGLENEAFEAMYAPGERVVQKKAIWYRRQKRILKQALELGVEITADMTQKDAAEAVEAAREAAKTQQQREADALQMLKRSMKGAVKASGDVSKIKEAVSMRTSPGRSRKVH